MRTLISRKGTLLPCVIFASIFMPLAANARLADIISLLSTITRTLNESVGQVLTRMQAIDTTMKNLQQELVWPVALIAQAKASVEQARTQFSTPAAQIHDIQNASATLLHPARLEALLRAQAAGNVIQIDTSYAQVYPSLPAPGHSTAELRNLMDIDDALALGAMKGAALSERTSGEILTFADALEREAVSAAPGSAPILTAQAQVASLQGQAMLQKMLAADLRQQAAALAHSNALRKQSADAMKGLRHNLLEILSRP